MHGNRATSLVDDDGAGNGNGDGNGGGGGGGGCYGIDDSLVF